MWVHNIVVRWEIRCGIQPNQTHISDDNCTNSQFDLYDGYKGWQSGKQEWSVVKIIFIGKSERPTLNYPIRSLRLSFSTSSSIFIRFRFQL